MASTVTALQLASVLTREAPAPVYLVVGEEDLLRDSAVGTIKKAVLGDGGEFNEDVFYGDDASGVDIVTCAVEMPVFAERRLVVVKAAEKLSARDGEALLPYLGNPMDRTTLVFVSAKLDGRLKFSQAVGRAASTVDCGPLRDAQLTPWLLQEAERVGIRLNEEALAVLKEASGGSLYGLRRELEKLASYVPPGRSVQAADVYVLRGLEPGASVFDLTLAIAEADRERVLGILARNLEAGEAPLRLLGSLAWQYRRVWKVKDLIQRGGREGEAARTLRMDPQKVRVFLERFTEEHLREALRLFLHTDAQLKGGSSAQPRIVLDRLLLRLCDFVRPGSSESPREPPRRSSPPAGRATGRVVSNVRTIKRGNQRAR